MLVLRIFFRYFFLSVFCWATLACSGQFIDSLTLQKSVGCFPYAVLANSWDNSAFPIAERIWYLTDCSGKQIFTTPAGSNINFAYAPQSAGCYCLRLWVKNQNGDTAS